MRYAFFILRFAELTCAQYQALPVNERAPEDLAFNELANKEKWRRCPKVRSRVSLFGFLELNLSTVALQCSAMVELKVSLINTSLVILFPSA